MIAMNHNVVDNKYIESLQYLAKRDQNAVEWLVITHDDPALIRRLGKAFSDDSAVVLPISQSLWETEMFAIEETIAWALSEMKITSLIFVGSSLATIPIREAVFTQKSFQRSSSDTIIHRVIEAEARHPRARQHFIDCFISFLSEPNLAERRESPTFSVNGFFYRADCGVFNVYDHESGVFRPLISS